MTAIVDFVKTELQIELAPWQEEMLREYGANSLLSERTRQGLAAAKARGVKLGGDRGYRITEEARQAGSAARKAKADEHALAVYAQAEDTITAEGATMRGVAEVLNERGVPTPSGSGAWGATTVKRLIRRLEALGKLEPEEDGSWLD